MPARTESLSHEPIREVRKEVIGEVVMVANWKAFMREEVLRAYDHWEMVTPLFHILPCDLNQRAATVAASFMRWIGTNCGRSFLDQGQKMMGAHKGDGYLLAWTLENQRKSGARTIDYVLSPASNFAVMSPCWYTGLKEKPMITDTDCEVIEAIACWLGSPDGQHYLATSEKQIQQVLAFERQQLSESRMVAPAH